MEKIKTAKFFIGQLVRHKFLDFRGLVFDVDPTFEHTEEWYLSIPANIRPNKDQPFYHLFAEGEDNSYVAYVSEQNLVPDEIGEPLDHPDIEHIFTRNAQGRYEVRNLHKQ